MARRFSAQTVKVVEVLLKTPHAEHYGYDLIGATGLKAGTLYPILRRLEEKGHLRRRTEPNPREGFPARKQYRLTAGASQVLAAELMRVYETSPQIQGVPQVGLIQP